MSQSGPLNETNISPVIATTYTEEFGIAIPAANNLFVLGGSTAIGRDIGITTIGSGDTVSIALTNRIYNQIATITAVPTTLITHSLGSNVSVFSYIVDVSVHDAVNQKGAKFTISAVAINDGVNASIIGIPQINQISDVSLLATAVSVTTSGTDVLFQVTGILGVTIVWVGTGYWVES